ENKRGHEAANKERPIPSVAPRLTVTLRTVFECHRTKDERSQDGKHRQVKARKRNRVEWWPGRKDRSASDDQPDLIALPYRADSVDDNTTLHICFRNERQKRCGAKIEAIHHSKADQQHAEQQ